MGANIQAATKKKEQILDGMLALEPNTTDIEYLNEETEKDDDDDDNDGVEELDFG